MTLFVVCVACDGDPPNLPGYLGLPIEAPSDQYAPCASSRDLDVRCVIDGDTISAGRCEEAGERVRLLGINAPEISHDGAPAECYGEQATEELRQLLQNETVLMTFGVECQDAYERTLAWLWLLPEDDDPILVSEWMLRYGHARLYDGEGAESLVYRTRLAEAEQSAMEAQIGLWGECID